MNHQVSLLLKPWTGSMGGLPPLESVSVPELKRALNQGLAQAKYELGELLEKVYKLYDGDDLNLLVIDFKGTSTHNNQGPQFQSVSPTLS